MLGKTHFFIGISTALAVLQPQSVPVLVTGISAAAVGSVISDIDSGTSQAHQEADKVMAVTVSVIGLMLGNLTARSTLISLILPWTHQTWNRRHGANW